jgi:hypothetical protein
MEGGGGGVSTAVAHDKTQRGGMSKDIFQAGNVFFCRVAPDTRRIPSPKESKVK